MFVLNSNFKVYLLFTFILLATLSCSNAMEVDSSNERIFDGSGDIQTDLACGIPDVPKSLTPENNSTLSDGNPTFSWERSNCSVKYELEIAADKDFTKAVLKADEIEGIEYKLPAHLSLYSGGYFWRVKGRGAGGVWSDHSEVRHFEINLFNTSIIKTVPSKGETGVFLNSDIMIFFSKGIAQGISADNLMEVRRGLINGEKVAGTLSYDANSKSLIFNAGEQFAPNENYYAILLGNIPDVSGDIIPRYVFDFRTSNRTDEYPPIIVETNPQNATKGHPINAAMTVTFSEQIRPPSINPNDIRLDDVKGNSVEVTLVYNSSGNSASVVPVKNLEYETIYILTIGRNIIDLAGNQMTSDTIVTFQTAKFPDYVPPDLPILISPSNEGTIGDPNPIFVWKGSSDSVRYRVQIASDGKFSNILFDLDTITSQQFEMPPHLSLNEGIYYWRLKAVDICDNWSEFTTSNKFTVKTFNTDILKTIPANGEGNVPTNQSLMILFVKELDQNASLENSIRLYQNHQGGTKIDGKIFYDGPSKSAIFTPSAALQKQQNYYVEFTGGIKDRDGSEIGPYAFIFKTSPSDDLISPEIDRINPMHGSKGFPINASMTITFNEDMLPSSVVKSNFTLTKINVGSIALDVSYDVYTRKITITPQSDLSYETIYTLDIAANLKDLAGNALKAGQTIAFETARVPDYTPPTPPALQSPLNGASTTDANPTFVWQGSSDSVKYHIQISKYSGFTNTILEVDTITDLNFTMPIHLLLYEGTYYWRVRAADACDNWSDWSDSFILYIVPTTPGPSSPSSSTICSSTTPALAWNSVKDVTSYRVEVSRDQAFSNVVWTEGNFASSNISVPSGKLSPGIYYWRIRSEIWSNGENVFNSKWSEGRALNIKQIKPKVDQYQVINSEDNGLTLTFYSGTLDIGTVVDIEKYTTSGEIAQFNSFSNPNYRIATPVYKIGSNSAFKKAVNVKISVADSEMTQNYGMHAVNSHKMFYRSSPSSSWTELGSSYVSSYGGKTIFNGSIDQPGLIVGAADIQKHCKNGRQEADVGETGIDCGGNCPTACTDCNGYDFGSGPESDLYSFNDPAVVAAANEALNEYAQYRGKGVGSFTVYEKMEAVARYVTTRMRWMRDEGDWEGAQTARTTIIDSGNRTGWFVGKEEAKDPNYSGVKYGHCIRDGGNRWGKEPKFCGDCEDHAILRASLMRHVGINSKCVMIAEYHDSWCHPTNGDNCTPWSTPASSQTSGSSEEINDFFDQDFLLFGAPENSDENVLKKGSHAFNVILYKNKFRIFDFWNYDSYFHAPTKETDFSYYHHRADNVFNDHFGYHWNGPITPPPAVIKNYKDGPVCYEKGLNYWTHFNLFDGYYDNTGFVEICP
ncbi:MAG: Ig-like domain-containing protein [Pseudomonadota bacterium]